MATVRSEQTLKELAAIAEDVWLGATDRETEGRFKWIKLLLIVKALNTMK